MPLVLTTNDVVLNPDHAWNDITRASWFGTIEDYVPFTPPVHAKPDGVFYEQIAPNMWRNGVRTLDQEAFDRTFAAAGRWTAVSTPTIIAQPRA